MTPARLEKIEEIFCAALDQEPDKVAQFLDSACDGDEVLRRKVESLLTSYQQSGGFIETSAAGVATRIIESEQAELLAGQTFGHYKISKRIGTGGMGEVYLATDIIAGRKAALKLLPTQFTGNPERLKRFQREARAVVGLNHPNILTVYEIGEDHSTRYIASELIEGETLHERLKHGRMQVSEAVDVAIQVASALTAAHDAGVVHRDIKPENIMLRPDGYVKVLDFGIAKLAEQGLPATTPKDEALLLIETNLGSILGTVRYMSPEQGSGAQVDKRTDIWSLGVVLYEMTTGHAPFTGDTPGEVMSAILEKEPPPLTHYIAHAPAELRQIISKALRKDRTERYQSADEMLQALKTLRHKLELKAAPLWLRWVRSPGALVPVLLVLAVALALPFYRHRNLTTTPPPEKSIAVLPLENLSTEKENAFFADGIHDELLSNLSKIKDLKVISRTSVRQYKSGNPRNIREIGQQLGVAHVLEGTVQRTANRVKVSAQLIDARNDTHLWAEHYDRDVADVFAIQSEIAQQIAEQLQAKLSAAEKAAIAEPPTNDLVAYAYYTKANEIDVWSNWAGWEKSANQKVELLEKAVQRDPNFALAYCALAKTQLYLGHDPKHFELGKKAAEAALRVRPDLGEAHLELARYYFYAAIFTDRNGYDRARDELTIARRKLPNNSEALLIAGKIDRHQNRWDSAVVNLRKATELDPRNAEAGYWRGMTYFEMRRYSEYEQFLTKDAASGDPWGLCWLARIKLAQGDPVAAQSLLNQVPIDFRPAREVWWPRFDAALYLRDYDAASRVIASTPGEWADDAAVAEGRVAHARGDRQKALAAFAAARKKLDATWGLEDDTDYLRAVSEIDAGLGRKDEAIREAQRAVDVTPMQTPLDRTYSVVNLALVYAWTGERERALEQLEKVAAIPAGPTYGDLLLNPCWDSLRGDPRFNKIVAAAKAASRYALEPLPEKSIAVLPLENLSDEKENAFFAAGIHDELLSNLSKIADLKVISRTSVMQYKSGNPRNIREIGQQLGVAHVLEGSVQRKRNRVKVSAQLIDARSDAHLWSQTYDRDLTDVFAIQSEIATTIANQLQAKLSPAESAAIAERPTADPVAYAYYAKANEMDIYSNWQEEENEKAAKQRVELLEKAIQRDPNFALAYCALTKAQIDVENFEAAKKAAETALRLRPDLPEPHLALARYYWLAPDSIGLDREAYYDKAREELAIVRRKLPNNPGALLIEALIGRRQNRWDASLANLRRANELDPQNGEVAYLLEQIFLEMRRYSELEQFIKKQAVSGGPRTGPLEDPFNWLAMMKLAQGDPVAAQSLLEQMPPEYSPGFWIWEVRFKAALYLRDYDAVNRVIAATQAGEADEPFGAPSSWVEGLVARARGDKQKAQAAFAAAREKMLARRGDKPKDAPYFADIAKLDAGLGRKEEAIREAQRAVELQPITKDSLNGPALVANLALVYAWTGERDRALEQLEKVATIPGQEHDAATYGDLLLNPCWDDLRGDPRFDKIVAAAKAASR